MYKHKTIKLTFLLLQFLAYSQDMPLMLCLVGVTPLASKTIERMGVSGLLFHQTGWQPMAIISSSRQKGETEHPSTQLYPHLSSSLLRSS